MVVTIDCKVHKVSLVFATWNRLTKGLSTMTTYFLTPEIRGSVINNTWPTMFGSRCPQKVVFSCSFVISYLHSSICAELSFNVYFWYNFLRPLKCTGILLYYIRVYYTTVHNYKYNEQRTQMDSCGARENSMLWEERIIKIYQIILDYILDQITLRYIILYYSVLYYVLLYHII